MFYGSLELLLFRVYHEFISDDGEDVSLFVVLCIVLNKNTKLKLVLKLYYLVVPGNRKTAKFTSLSMTMKAGFMGSL